MTFTMIYQVFPERMKIVEKLVANLHDKTEYIIHIRKLRQALNHGFEKLHRIIKFKRKASLKSYIAINTDLRKGQKIF